MKNKRKRMMRYRQKQLNQMFAYLLIMNIAIVFMIVSTVMVRTSGNNKNEGGSYLTVYESTIATISPANDNHNTATPPANVQPTITGTTNLGVFQPETEPDDIEEFVFDRGLSEDDKYLLAKLVMAEAEGESLEAKVMIAWVVLNRVESSEAYFPDTIKGVIFQKTNGVYQFTPIGNGRWDRVEPNEECWEAINIVNTIDYDFSDGALYFEACSGESWHSRNLEFIRQVDNTRFYK